MKPNQSKLTSQLVYENPGIIYHIMPIEFKISSPWWFDYSPHTYIRQTATTPPIFKYHHCPFTFLCAITHSLLTHRLSLGTLHVHTQCHQHGLFIYYKNFSQCPHHQESLIYLFLSPQVKQLAMLQSRPPSNKTSFIYFWEAECYNFNINDATLAQQQSHIMCNSKFNSEAIHTVFIYEPYWIHVPHFHTK